ncbi:2-dehydro-3-deoxygluconokinase [Frondihabitans sp. 762G35]|uniref:carbohydrate kinase family protein n=1 Tax=Frondihabitans sp. 762G35 TaxID=1446794 RepID=UPI000D22C48E|nr:carbohydrate kinase [Frondihabitans sp. 762G35]ARC57892.1 2-dehydro-3-deoxygluconokinase [Frondihabitans sp. 762G35]
MTSTTPTAFVVGEALVDIVVDGDEHREHAGGSPMNVAYGLARLGVDTALRAQLGQDARGRAIEEHLAGAGVHLDPATFHDGSTSTAVATIQADRTARYDFDIAWDPGAIEVPAGVRLVHTGSIASALAPGSAAVLALFEANRGSALLSFDPNVRPSITPSRDDVLTTVDALASLAHVVKMSDEDAEWLHPGVSLDEVLDRYLGLGAVVAAITRGGEGCSIATREVRLTLPSLPVDVVDTIGAGDAFMSGLLFAILSRGLDGPLREGVLGEDDLRAVAATALASARVTVSRAGANPPTPAELAA